MSTKSPRKLTPSELGQLAGLASAEALTPEQRSARAAKGGQAVLDMYGRSHFKRMILKRWGKLESVEPKKQRKAKREASS